MNFIVTSGLRKNLLIESHPLAILLASSKDKANLLLCEHSGSRAGESR
jgi:hypothetical protein